MEEDYSENDSQNLADREDAFCSHFDHEEQYEKGSMNSPSFTASIDSSREKSIQSQIDNIGQKFQVQKKQELSKDRVLREMKQKKQALKMEDIEEEYQREKNKLEIVKQRQRQPRIRKSRGYLEDASLFEVYKDEYQKEIREPTPERESNREREDSYGTVVKEWNSTTETILSLLVTLEALTPTMTSTFLPFSVEECLDRINNRAFWLKNNINHKIQLFRFNRSLVFNIEDSTLRDLWLIYFTQNEFKESGEEDLRWQPRPVLSDLRWKPFQELE